MSRNGWSVVAEALHTSVEARSEPLSRRHRDNWGDGPTSAQRYRTVSAFCDWSSPGTRPQESERLSAVVDDVDDPARSLEEHYGPPGRLVDTDAGWTRRHTLVVGAGPEELAVADDNAICV